MAGAATVEKALDVLFHLHEAGTSVGLSEIGRALDLPKSSCHRLLTSLVEREVVDRDEGGRYRPGLALLSLGLGAQRREPVVSAARSALEEEASTFGEKGAGPLGRTLSSCCSLLVTYLLIQLGRTYRLLKGEELEEELREVQPELGPPGQG